jgi:hypothetical protein
MSRKISILFVLALFVLAICCGSVFAAKAKSPAATGNQTSRYDTNVPLPKLSVAGAEAAATSGGSGKPTGYTAHQSLGFNPDAVRTVGATYQDYQSNGSMGRRIAIGGGWVHNVIMDLAGPSTSSDRTVAYYGYSLSSATFTENLDIDALTAGYPQIGTVPGGNAVATWHRVGAGGTRTGVDFSVGAGSFTNFTFPTVNCQSIVTGVDATEGPYIWPYSAVDDDGGQAIVHAVGHESPTTAGDIMSLVYFRSNQGITASGPTCGFWIDSVDNIGSVIAADPNSDEVAIVYFIAKDQAFTQGTQQHNMDVVYRKSSDKGQNWGARVNITNYTGAIKERGYTDCDAMYTRNGCLHVAWNAVAFDSNAGAGAGISDRAKLRHWDDCAQCISLALDANNEDLDADPGAWNKNVCKMNLSECIVDDDTVLYLTYTRFLGDADGTPPQDHSAASYANGEIFAQASSTGGTTWGPPVNLTNSNSNNCAAGACFSEHWSSSALYVTDSLRIFYVEDKDAGGIVQTEGSWQNSPVKNMSVGCFAMATFVELGSSPAEIGYPFNLPPGNTKDTTFVISNSGNSATTFTLSSSQPWITFPGGTSGNCGAGCTNTTSFVARISTMGFPGGGSYATANISVTYPSPDKGPMAVLAIPVELHAFPIFYLPQDTPLRTFYNRLNTNQNSQVSNNVPGRMFSYFADTSDYLYEGHLIIGNDALNLTYSVFGGVGNPTASNPYGYLYAASAGMPIDSNSFATYRIAQGKGVNRDSTVGFDVKWYASKHPDTADGYVGIFSVYKGPKNPTGTVSNLSLAYYGDWDVPSDSGSDNTPGSDAGRAMVWQRGAYGPPNDTRYGGTAAYRNDGNNVVGGWVLSNPIYIYPDNGYDNDSIWAIMEGLTQGQYRLYSGVPEDISGGILIHRDASINGTNNDTLKFGVIIAGTRNGGISGLNTAVDRLQKFLCGLGLLPGADICSACNCGDADGNGIFTISDAVFLINFIFAGGTAPDPLCEGDADGNGIITISDAVYLINFIFAGGPPPHCP